MSTEENTPPYIFKSPKGPEVPFLFTAPHSGRVYPSDMTERSALSEADIRLSEDAYVDNLFEQAPNYGASLLIATHARAYLDRNRAENELDPNMFTPALDTASVSSSHRVRAGLGVIPRIVAEGKQLYTQALPAREVEKRLSAVYRPYHTKLQQLQTTLRQRHKVLYMIDSHSMPSTGAGKGRSLYRGKKTGPDIVLGDCWGSSCDTQFTGLVEETLLAAGFSVKRNTPYSGGFTTTQYGKPAGNTHALQIEINRALYMNEATHTSLPDFHEIQKLLASVCQKVIKSTLSGQPTMVKMQHQQAAE